MKNADQWQPSKYVYRRGKLVGSRDPREVSVASRLVTDVVARLYDRYIVDHCRGKLVDLGCGKVPLYQAYRDHVVEIVCVDKPGTPHGTAFIDYECDLSQRLPFRDGEFDTVILSDVLEHLAEPQHLFHEMARICVGGGKCLISVPFYYGLHEEPHDYYRYTEFALRRLAEGAGFNVVLIESSGGAPEIMADLLAKNVVTVPAVGKYLAIAVQAVTGFFISTSVGKKLSRRSGKRYPFSYFMVVEKTA